MEEDINRGFRPLHPGDTYLKSCHQFHRIDDILDAQGVWTLFISYKEQHIWGFLEGVPVRKVHFNRRYLKNATAEENEKNGY